MNNVWQKCVDFDCENSDKTERLNEKKNKHKYGKEVKKKIIGKLHFFNYPSVYIQLEDTQKPSKSKQWLSTAQSNFLSAQIYSVV